MLVSVNGEMCVLMAQGNQPKQGLDALTILCGGISVMLTLPMAPKFREITAEPTYRSLVQEYGQGFADFGMLLHAGASFVVTFLGLLIVLRLSLALLMSQITRRVSGSRSSRW